VLRCVATYNRFTPANINFYNCITCVLGALQFLSKIVQMTPVIWSWSHLGWCVWGSLWVYVYFHWLAFLPLTENPNFISQKGELLPFSQYCCAVHVLLFFSVWKKEKCPFRVCHWFLALLLSLLCEYKKEKLLRK